MEHIGATEDEAACRAARPGGTRLHFDSSSNSAGSTDGVSVRVEGRAEQSVVREAPGRTKEAERAHIFEPVPER